MAFSAADSANAFLDPWSVHYHTTNPHYTAQISFDNEVFNIQIWSKFTLNRRLFGIVGVELHNFFLEVYFDECC